MKTKEDIMDLFKDKASTFDMMLWFISPNKYLGGRMPMLAMNTDGDLVYNVAYEYVNPIYEERLLQDIKDFSDNLKNYTLIKEKQAELDALWAENENNPNTTLLNEKSWNILLDSIDNPDKPTQNLIDLMRK